VVSHIESTGLALLEGMGQGCVGVASRCKGPSYIIQDGDNGLLYDIGRVNQLADAIQRLGVDRSLLARLGAAARERAFRDFSFEAYMPWFLDLCEQVWREPARPWPKRRPVRPPAGKRSWPGWRVAVRSLVGRG
jgi:glycosyltransferase involved in cell wall biosynthesis